MPEFELERPKFILERCGLCCIVIPTTKFSKGGFVCQHLFSDGEATRCAIYSSRPQECQNFHCKCEDMITRLDDFVLQVMRGQQSIIHYIENKDEDGGYIEAEDVLTAVLRMSGLNMFCYSLTIRNIRYTKQIPLELSNSSREILEALGIHQFLK